MTWLLSWTAIAGCFFLCQLLSLCCDIQTAPRAFASPVVFSAAHACIGMCWLSCPEVWYVCGCADFLNLLLRFIYPILGNRARDSRKKENCLTFFLCWNFLWRLLLWFEVNVRVLWYLAVKYFLAVTLWGVYIFRLLLPRRCRSNRAVIALKLWFTLSEHCTRNHSSFTFLGGVDLLAVLYSIVFMPGTISSVSTHTWHGKSGSMRAACQQQILSMHTF